MKKTIVLIVILIAGAQFRLSAQQQEAQQLALNVQKLAQFRQILSNMKKGYQIISKGYNTIKDLSEGNFSLHKTFLDGLLAVSPAVRKYKRVTDIISNQVALVKEYKQALNRFRSDGNFNPQEIEYLAKVYSNLLQKSLDDLDELTMVVTDSKLRMSDEERLEAIDRIFADMQDKLAFLRHFNNNTTILAIQRAREKKDAVTLQKIYGITN